MYKKIHNKIINKYLTEPAYIQEKVKTLIKASYYIWFIASVGFALHLIEQKPWTVIAGDMILFLAAGAIFPLVYQKRFELAANLMIWALVLVVIIHNPVTDYLYATSASYYRILETVISFIIIILLVTTFVYKTYQIILASAAGFIIITAHYFLIIEKFYEGNASIHSLSLFISYLLLFFIVCIITFRLLNTFHLLINKLEEESSKVKKYNRELEARAQERTKVLERQNYELKKLNEELDRYVYRISHDLRAPLTSVLGLINICKYETDLHQIRNYLELKEKSVLRLDNFIQDMISISKNARLENKYEEIYIQQLIESSFEQYNYLENFNSIKKVISVQQACPFVTDKYRLTTILNNLISNAIRYASPHRRTAYIKITADITLEKARIEVTDNGRGIAAEYIGKIFSMFFRANHDTAGSGLGLYIVKETVEKLQGHVLVKSTLAQGATFTIEIPNKVVNYATTQLSSNYYQISDPSGASSL